MTFPKIVSGFTVIPVAYSHSTHIIYARAHVSSKSAKSTFPPDRTLFLVNVPVDATDRELSLFFKYAGTVERAVFSPDELEDPESPDGVSDTNSEDEEGATSAMEVDTQEADEGLHRKRLKRKKGKKDGPIPPSIVPLPVSPLRTLRKTGTVAHLVFLDATALAKALTHVQKPRPWPSSEEPRGLSHYRALYEAQRPPLDIVKAHADSAIQLYEFEVARSKQKSTYRKGEAVVDEDGFTLVTRGGAYGQTLGGGVGVASKQFQATGKTGSRKKKEPKEKVSFYGFQKAERQRKGNAGCSSSPLCIIQCWETALLDLKKNFEADKARIEKLKESRRFKPY
ncbi:hypothetical protein ID866_9112 [Astraeus odoratus]|nr:hypothetical protein ID866_9112 [Astraeus odoratus]